MKKMLLFVKSFVLTFVIHFAMSLLFDFLSGDYETIGIMIATSLLFDVIYHILIHFVKKCYNNET